MGGSSGSSAGTAGSPELNAEDVGRWLEAYGRAWETFDPDAAIQLFTEDASYQETPFEEPMRGRGAIRAYWARTPEYHQDVSFDSEVLHVEDAAATAHWWVSYVRATTGEPTKLDGIFLLEFDAAGLCRSLREWWHRTPEPPEGE